MRLSGSLALDIIGQLFVSPAQTDLRSAPGYTVHYGHLLHPEHKTVLDEVLVSVMRSPASYTREDVVEINCHGGSLPLRTILDAVLACGARLAEPGEFTKRAFLNGRIDLSQAESVIDIIRAKTDAGLQLAVKQLQGNLSRHVSTLREALSHLLASIEASIDFTDEDIELISAEQVQQQIEQGLAELERLLAGAYEGKIVRDGLTIAIVGKPNVGKSSLLNLFLEEERAIVTPIPGTTRDTIEDYVNLRGIPLRLIDTAGIRDTENHVERLGVGRSQKMIKGADLVLCMIDVSVPWSVEDTELVRFVGEKKMFLVANKTDLPAACSRDDIQAHISDTAPVFPISIEQHTGIDALKQALVQEVMDVPLESVLVSNTRHRQALVRARDSLRHARESAAAQMSQEFIALDIRDALQHVGEITGETTTEDILGVIFSTFCVGK